jgi:hypothetical protein
MGSDAMFIVVVRRVVSLAALSIFSSSIAFASVPDTGGVATSKAVGPGHWTIPEAAVDRAASTRPEIRLAQDNSKVGIKVVIDSKKNRDWVKKDDQFASFVYEAITDGGTTKIQPASKHLMGVWKGNATIQEQRFAGPNDLESPGQFGPVFIVAEIRNDGTRPIQVTSAYLDVAESATDYQPYLEIGGIGRVECHEGKYAPEFDLANYGWGPVQDGKLVFSFGSKTAKSSKYTASFGTFDERTTATVDGAVREAGADVTKLGDAFKCASKSQVPACLARLKGTGVLGTLSNYVYPQENRVLTLVEGNIEYDWVDYRKERQHRSSPFVIDIPILFFDVGGGPECGAPGPVDRDDKPIQLSLDRQNYRLPLSFRGQVGSRQVTRLGLTLAAEKASHHVLKLVLSLADGTVISSGPVDITYFKPRMSFGSPDEPEDKN